MPANTAEAKKAAAQLSEAAGAPTPALAPTSAIATPDPQTDRTTVPGYTSNSRVDISNKPRQPLYENSAAAGGNRDMSMNDTQRDSGAPAANGQRGEIGVWLTENGGRGVRVGRLARDGAAERAGLKSGDIILQVNGNGVASPSATAQQIRQIPIGQMAMLTVVRDGEQKQMQVTLLAARPGQQYQVGYGGDEGNNRSAMETDSSGLAARTSRLEQQIESMTEELRQMRQQMSTMRTGSTSTSGAGAESGSGIGTTPSAVSPAPSSAMAPQSGAASTTPSSSVTPISTPTSSASPAAGGPSTPSAPSAVGSSGSADKQDLFGGTPSSSSSSPSGGTSK
jgi:hypothetical protein